MSNDNHDHVMSPATAEDVRGLLNVCGDSDEELPPQRENQNQKGPTLGATFEAASLHAKAPGQRRSLIVFAPPGILL